MLVRTYTETWITAQPIMNTRNPMNNGLGPVLLFCAVLTLCMAGSAAAQSTSAANVLLERGVADLHGGQPEQAAATLERALRIEPRNPAILHYLGQTRLQQGRYDQAEALATQSNTLAGSDRLMRERNARLIQAAREGGGNHRQVLDDSERLAMQQRLDLEAEQRRQAEARVAMLEQRTPPATMDTRFEPEPDEGKYRKAHWKKVHKAKHHKGRGSYAKELPAGHLPPPGMCRIWFPGRPPGHQPAPGRCRELRHEVPVGAWLVRG